MHTASQVNRAGKTLRQWLQARSLTLADQEVQDALKILTDYRAAHARPLLKANSALRSVVRSEGCEVEVSQRLKRMSTILDKLVRQPNMSLSRMQDIGGCRAILGNLDELRRVEARLKRRRAPVRVDDYVASPRSSGYRSIYLVVQYDGRNIEVQLRTRLMHEWAVAVERLGGNIDADLKSGKGPPQILQWLEAIAEALAIEDAGETVDSALAEEIGRLRLAALPFMSGGSR